MNRVMLTAVVAAGMVLAGCGGSEIAVRAQIEATADGEPLALRDLPVRILPYDRDVIFDSLRAAYPEPQPEIPPALQQLEAQISAAQEQWQAAEQRWIMVRDSLQRMSRRMQGMNRQSGEYLLLFREFQALEGQESGLRRESEQAFARFTELQQQYSGQADEIRVARETWAEDAYAKVDSIIGARLRVLRREERADTTGSGGTVRIRVPAGQWWVHARYDLPYQELYWNIPVEVPRGEQVMVELTRQNAELRPKL
jgi:hypothetical protein